MTRYINYLWRKLFYIQYYRPFCSGSSSRAIIAANRATLSSVDTWIDDASMEHSVFGYGIPSAIKSLTDLPINNDMIYTDTICSLVKQLRNPLSYLEIGVSIGKNFLQVVNAVDHAELTGFDIENINPVLESRFSNRLGVRSWEPPATSMRKLPCSLAQYTFRSNKISYLTGDAFDTAAWSQLAGQRYNFIYSDAFHSPDALLTEWEHLSQFNLIDPDSYILMWDDLGGSMTDAFRTIVEQIRRKPELRPTRVALYRYSGWNGQHESKHLFGLIARNVAF